MVPVKVPKGFTKFNSLGDEVRVEKALVATYLCLPPVVGQKIFDTVDCNDGCGRTYDIDQELIDGAG